MHHHHHHHHHDHLRCICIVPGSKPFDFFYLAFFFFSVLTSDSHISIHLGSQSTEVSRQITYGLDRNESSHRLGFVIKKLLICIF